MTCQQVSAVLSALLDGELPPAEAATVELHLAECQQCQAEYRALAEARRLLLGLPVEEPSPGVAHGLRRRLRKHLALLVVLLLMAMLLALPAWTILGLALRQDLPNWARAGYLVSGLCFTMAMTVICYHLLRRLRTLVGFAIVVGEEAP